MRYRLNKGFISQKINQQTVIFDSETSVFYYFNQTAQLILNKLKSGWDCQKIADYITSNYDVKKERSLKDVKQIISQLTKKSIITPIE